MSPHEFPLFNPAVILCAWPLGIVLDGCAARPIANGFVDAHPALLGRLVPVEGCARLIRRFQAEPCFPEGDELVHGEAMLPPARHQPVAGGRVLHLQFVDPFGQ